MSFGHNIASVQNYGPMLLRLGIVEAPKAFDANVFRIV